MVRESFFTLSLLTLKAVREFDRDPTAVSHSAASRRIPFMTYDFATIQPSEDHRIWSYEDRHGIGNGDR
jgi:hypothetical protein